MRVEGSAKDREKRELLFSILNNFAPPGSPAARRPRALGGARWSGRGPSLPKEWRKERGGRGRAAAAATKPERRDRPSPSFFFFFVLCLSLEKPQRRCFLRRCGLASFDRVGVTPEALRRRGSSKGTEKRRESETVRERNAKVDRSRKKAVEWEREKKERVATTTTTRPRTFCPLRN